MTTSTHHSTGTSSSGTADASHLPPSQSTIVASTLSPSTTPIKIHPSTNANTIGGGGGGMAVHGPQTTDTPSRGTTTVMTDVAPQLDITSLPDASKNSTAETYDDSSSTTEAATSILLGVQALERQQQQKQYELEALGVWALERQQAEVEARRRRSNSFSKSLTAPLSTSPSNTNNRTIPASNVNLESSPRRRTDNPIPPQVLAPAVGRATQNPFIQPSSLPPYPHPPSSVLVGHPAGGIRDPTVTTAASGSEGEGSSSFGHGYGSGNEWYINREYQAHQDEDSEDQLKRSGSVSRFLQKSKTWFLTGEFQEEEQQLHKDESNSNSKSVPQTNDNRQRITSTVPYMQHSTRNVSKNGLTISSKTLSSGNVTSSMESKLMVDASGTVPPKRVLQPLLYGYLHKRGRTGQWQRRWFEIDGKSLSYFKSKKHTSESDVLATLDLSRVGEIKMDESDPQGCTFTIRVAKRNYYLHAETRERAMDWVISLNRVREARLQIGGLTLIEPSMIPPSATSSSSSVALGRGGSARDVSRGRGTGHTSSDEENGRYRSDDGVEGFSARVGLVSGRERTKGYGKDDLNEDLRSFFVQPTTQSVVGMEVGSIGIPPSTTSVGGRVSPTSSPKISYAIPPRGYPPMTQQQMYPPMPYVLPPVPEETEFGRWEKRRNNLQNWTRRLSRWARRMTMIRCVIKDDVVPFANSPPQFVQFPPHLSYMNYDPRIHYLHATNPTYDYYSDAQNTARSLGQISEGEGSHSKASANEDHDSFQNPPSVGSAEAVGFTGYEKYKHRTDDGSYQSNRVSSGRGSPAAEYEDGVV